MKKVSIVIPVKEINDYIRESIPHILELDYDDFEILIFPDEETTISFPKTRIIPSGKAGPAEKRDMAITYARGEILAFIDDDAYPRRDWLRNAVDFFDDDGVGAVGGPAVTPENDNMWKQASGKVYESFLCSGGYNYRYLPKKKREVDDYPSVNLLVRAELFRQIGGFDSNYYPGEDTKLCLDITKRFHKKIIYSPDVLVWHHRRNLFRPHLKQATNYALHRGFFVKALPETSFKAAYFVPSLFTIGFFGGPVLCGIFPVLWKCYAAVLVFYFILAAISIQKTSGIRVFILSILGIFATHIGYGICFIRGLMSKKLIR